jgi:hypothetical protein
MLYVMLAGFLHGLGRGLACMRSIMVGRRLIDERRSGDGKDESGGEGESELLH